jgi:hypothetical protein
MRKFIIILLICPFNVLFPQKDTNQITKNKIDFGFLGKSGYLGIHYGRKFYANKKNDLYAKISLYASFRPGIAIENVRFFGQKKRFYLSGEIGNQFSNYAFPIYGKDIHIEPEDWRKWHGNVFYIGAEFGMNWKFIHVGLNTSAYNVFYSRINENYFGLHLPGVNLSFKF